MMTQLIKHEKCTNDIHSENETEHNQQIF